MLFFKKKKVNEVKEKPPKESEKLPKGIVLDVLNGQKYYRVEGRISRHKTLEQAINQLEGMKNGNKTR